MSIFKEFSYRLLRTFALTTAFTGSLLLYMAFVAIRGNMVFLVTSVIMFVLTAIFAYQSWDNYQHRPIRLKESTEVYGSVCPHCGEMLKVDETRCPQCHGDI